MAEENEASLPSEMRDLIDRGKARGYLTFNEVSEATLSKVSTKLIIDGEILARVLAHLKDARVYFLEEFLQEDQEMGDKALAARLPDPARNSRIRAAYEAQQQQTLEFLWANGWKGSFRDLQEMVPQNWHGVEE